MPMEITAIMIEDAATQGVTSTAAATLIAGRR
jgi:hypothetical protein